jgi:hypothetical protein
MRMKTNTLGFALSLLLMAPVWAGEGTPDPDFHLDQPRNGSTISGVSPALAWSIKTRPQKFRLQVSDKRDFSDLKVNEEFLGNFLTFNTDDLAENTKYFWRVIAIDQGGGRRVPNPSLATFTTGIKEEAPEPKPRTPGIIRGLQSSGFRLGRTYLDTQKSLDESNAATLSFSKSAGDDSVFSTEFALAYAPANSAGNAQSKRSGDLYFYFLPSIEANLTSAETEATDAIKSRATFRIYHSSKASPAEQARQIFDNEAYLISFRHEASQSFDFQTLAAELQVLPTKKRWHMGQARPLFGSKNVRFRWQPVLGVDLGSTIAGATPAENGEVIRLLGRAKADFILKRFLGVENVVVFVDNSFYHLPNAIGRQDFNYLSSGIEFPLNDFISLVASYKVGREAPTFQKVEVIGASIGVKF